MSQKYPQRESHPRPAQRPSLPPALRPLALALACAAVGLPAAAQAPALPSGPSVARGQASFATQGNQLTVTNSAGAVVNWQSFSIGERASVRFEQPHASSQVLNRVLGRDPSQILGQLSSNGGVWLVNPYGVLFGANARIDVASLVASTLAISDADFAAQRYRLFDAQAPGAAGAAVVNLGELRTTAGGRLLLVGGSGGVRNEGTLDAPGGHAALVAASSVDLADSSAPQIVVRITEPLGQAVNLGRISAAGGRIDLLAAMVNQHGIVRADALGAGPGGEIVLRATTSADLGAASRTSADGATGGRVAVEAGTVLAAGAISATGSEGAGGRVDLTGGNVGLLEGARLDASGATGGGRIRVGGGAAGQDPTIANAQAVYVAPGAALAADATRHGDGGSVVLWSDRATRAFGSFSARGGPAGGDGGLVETSGAWLDARPTAVRTDAPRGRAGQWLLDPNNTYIDNGIVDTNITGGPNFTTTNDSARISMATLAAALSAGNNVTVSTGAAGSNSQPGDITFGSESTSLLITNPTPVTLTLNAARNIDVLDSTIASSGNPFSLVLNAAGSGQGVVFIDSSSITTHGGSITIGGGGVACGAAGCAPFQGAAGFAGRTNAIEINGSTLNAAAGTIRLRGASGVDGALNHGVKIVGGSLLQARDIDIAGWVGVAGGSGVGAYIDAALSATRTMLVDGSASVTTASGVVHAAQLQSSSSLSLVPSADDPTARWRVSGTATGPVTSAVDVNGSTIVVAGRASADIVGSGGTTSISPDTIDAGAARSLTFASSTFVQTFGNITVPTAAPFGVFSGGDIQIYNGSITGNPTIAVFDAARRIDIAADSSGVVLNFGGALFSARAQEFRIGEFASASLDAGRVGVFADTVRIFGNTSGITASLAGDAIVFAGRNGNAQTFSNSAGASVLGTPNGRWLIYANDPTSGFSPGPLVNDFTQLGTTYSAAAVGSGNGFVFAREGLVDVRGTPGSLITKVYDGTTTANVLGSQLTLGGLFPGHRFVSSVGIGDFAYADRNVGTGIPVLASLTGPLPAVVDGQGRPVFGYAFTGTGPNLRGNITPRPLSVAGVSALDKVYDGTRAATLQVASLAGLVSGETLTIVPGTAQFDTADVGSDKPVTGTLSFADGTGGGRVSNYDITGIGQVRTTASITPRLLTAGGLVVDDKIYDATRTATVSGGSLSGGIAGESPTLVVLGGQFDTADAGRNKPVEVQLQLANSSSGALASNYRLVNSNVQARGNIVPREVRVTSIVADDKVYDGTLAATVHGGTIVGLVGTETLGLTASALFNTKDVGNDKPVTATVSLVDGTGRAANYTLGGGRDFVTTADITPRDVTVGGVSVAPRAYDGTRSATLAGSGTIGGLVGSETLTLQLGDALFDTKDAGTDKPVTASVALADGTNGGRAGNYRLAGGNALALRGTITPRLLTLASLSAADKVYDGTTAADVNAGALIGLVPGETLQATVVGRFDTADAGTGKTVTATLGLGSGTALVSNYRLDATLATTTASIRPRPVTVSGVVARDKVYDGTTAATLAAGSFSGLVAGESLALATQAQFDDPNAGSGRRVSGSVALADGTNGRAANYVLTNGGAFSGAASILPRGLMVSGATALDKTYDGTTAAQVSRWTLSGVLGSDQVVVTAGSGAFTDPNVGSAKTVVATASALGGAQAANYTLAQPSVNTVAGIRPATLTYVATPVVGAQGAPVPPLGGTVTGFVGGDTLGSSTSGAPSFTTTAVQGSPTGTYPVFGGGLAARNYVFAQAAGNATALSIVPMSTSQVAGGGDGAGGLQPTLGELASRMVSLPEPTSPQVGRTFDVMPALRAELPPAFRTLDVESMPSGALAMALAARDAYKKSIFAAALKRLEDDPTLADLPDCQTAEQAATGDCIVTEAVKPALRERLLREQALLAAAPLAAPVPTPAPAPSVAAGPAAPAPAATPAAPAAPPAAAPVPPPIAAPAAPPVAATAPPPVVAIAPPTLPPRPEVQLRLPAPRNVVAASLPQIRRKWALVIGTDEYVDTRIPQLDNAVGDAVAVGNLLDRTLGYEALVVRNGSKSAVIRAFNQLAALVAPQDSVVVYYAGHGELVEKTGLGYWQPADADSRRPETWISNSDIGKLLGLFGATQVALVSDSCFSGSLVADERIRPSTAPLDPSAVLTRKAAVVMSSGGNEPVFDSGKNGHSTFAWSLMRSLERVSAWRPGGNVFEQVRFAVARELPQRPQYGASRLGGHQSGADYLFEQRQLQSPK